MAGNSFGQAFRVTTAGESHGPGNVVIIDGVPAGLPLSIDDLAPDLIRRRPGQSKVTTQRKESDEAEILSGVFQGKTTGASIAILIRNEDQRSRDYSEIKEKYRPGHADYTYDAKYGFRDYRGGGRASARETNVRVAAGAVAKKFLKHYYDVEIVGYVKQIGDLIAEIKEPEKVTLEQVESNIVRCPDDGVAEQMIELIEEVRKDLDSLGGISEIVAKNVPAGWGEPVFDKLKADLAKGMLSIPAVLGFEYGSGFGAAGLRGSENNDEFVQEGDEIRTKTNRHGGILGGISTGMPIVVRCVVKPTSSLAREQDTVTEKGKETSIKTTGRHDPCLVPRFVPIGEAMMAIVLADHALRQKMQQQ
ncbi:MAG: Chorismate synthase [Candidatus Marinimicrobia bacterium]|nr:Chorismate synthase [Candidatus Neomarinimicrobiota bacterium]